MATITRVASIAVATAPGGGFLVSSDDGRVTVHAETVEVTDEVFVHLEAVDPLTEQERSAAKARLDAYLARRPKVPRQRDANV